jgi:uncharacterized protein
VTAAGTGVRGAAQPPVRLSRADARRALWRYHFEPGDLDAVVRRLGVIQYDPLAPLGRNPDLVLHARVPGYRIDAWQAAAYGRRLLVDAWDKMVCLTRTDDWPARHLFHAWFRERWRSRVFDPHADVVRATLAELRERGPLGTLDFADQSRSAALRGSWYGPKLVKHVLRALWDSGLIVTHARDKGRHVYDLPERSLPAAVRSEALGTEAALHRLVRRRVQAAGLLRPTAGTAVWYLPVSVAQTRAAQRALIEAGELLELHVDGARFLAVPEALAVLDDAPRDVGVRFVAPLDGLLWDRKGVAHLYDFDYVWEVYKPVRQRRWGYYVLPVLWGERFIARFDARVEGEALAIHAWHWEEPRPGAEALVALEAAATSFIAYLGVRTLRLPRGLDRAASEPWRRALTAARRLGRSAPAEGGTT